MLTLTILASGSDANCAVVSSEKTNIMVDCGLSRKDCVAGLAAAGINPERVSCVITSHGHQDHTSGIKGFVGRFGIPVWCSQGEFREIAKKCSGVGLKWFSPGSAFVVGNITVFPFSVPHDSPDPVGFRFQCGARAISYATDLGSITREVENHLLDVDTLAIESNFEESVLAASDYLPAIKKRVMSGTGHLSNNVVAGLLVRLTERTKTVVLLHLSESSNTPALAKMSAEAALLGNGVRVVLGQESLGVAL